MKRNILLVEPGYKTKFPPLGLMKISAYHKELGDYVKFVKGIDHQVPYENYWHRIYVSTVFTYHWKITVKTIKYYKSLVRGDISRIFVGGILATLMSEDLWKETGIIPIKGVLSEPGILDDNNYRVEEMIPDYDLFNGSPQKYSLVDDSYFGYSTRGCIRKCKFCGVHTLEPKFVDYLGIKPYVESIKKLYGEKFHLVLLDNNILASKKFKEIIHDLLDLGFQKDVKLSYKNKAGQTTYKERHVDFNQGTDARLMTESKIKLLAKIAINPLRIAFDHIKDEELYTKKIRLADKYLINKLSNYILYNFDDTPQDLWRRLKINIDLNKELGLTIYSFPMKYIPLNARDRSYIDQPRWNWQYIRGVQRILNVLKGTVMTKEDFFYRAFGDNEEKFLEILHMPEKLLMNRGDKPKPDEIDWSSKFNKLTQNERSKLLEILCACRKKFDILNAYRKLKNGKLKNMLEYYIPDEIRNDNLPLFED